MWVTSSRSCLRGLRDLGHPQAGAVGDAERGFVLQAGGDFDETGHLVLAQNDRCLARLLHRRQMPDEVGLCEGTGRENQGRILMVP